MTVTRPSLLVAHALRRARRLDEAASACQSVLAANPRDPDALHLLGLIREDAGDPAAAERLLRTSIALAPDRAEFRANLANLLFRLARLEEAQETYRAALALGPDRAATRHNFGSLLSHMGRAEEALEQLDHAAKLRLKSQALVLTRARVLVQLRRLDEAEDAYVSAVRIDPRNSEAHRELAQLRFMRGDPNFARDAAAAAAAHRDDPRLSLTVADILRRSRSLSGAEVMLRDLLERHGALPEARTALATVLHEMGRLNEAEIEALAAAKARPLNDTIAETLVVIRLALGRPDQVVRFIEAQRRRLPFDQRWIAHQAAAARLRGDTLYRDLYDYNRLVRVYELEPPPGWSTLSEFNDALTAVLTERHVFAMHPLSQSLRHGSQTARSLLQDPNPVIQAALRAFAAPIARYQQSIGNDVAHPLTARNRDPAVLRGCWSAQLRRAGFHVNHIHPRGWISSAYYASVPEEADEATLKRGWLKFGETPMRLPDDAPEHFVQPKAGRLALFPSYMWHGTNPIHSDTPRTTIAFDAVPAAR